ncbi:MAG TPA: hypothetical protein IAB02_04780 [Candidatus Pullichristensenella excrementigallinarum]|uniref:V-type proton ATPase subunit E n=1 Tax=Candidatus Pullichristensenella excrementigallinarum TaxID=2840907 RepID=A0A9D1IAU5_9FIRM|nr:hypothetical protein [Candidatus Pullichristensenella excrementigallinarum]
MNADAIINRILADARESAANAMRDAEARVEKLRAENADALEVRRVHAMEEAERQAAEYSDRAMRMAELEQKKELLAMKREVIDLAFEDALRRLNAMPREKAQEFFGKLVAQAAQGGEEIVPDRNHREIFDQDFVAKVKKETGKEMRLSKESREMGGGLVLRREGMEINLTSRAIVSQARQALEAEAAEMLFGR